MNNYTIIRLTNLTPLHLGRGVNYYDSTQKELHSDTLSAALAALYAQQGGEDVNGFIHSFAISSAFPFVGERYFLPRPLVPFDIKVANEKDLDIRKAVKKIKYLELSLWKGLAENRTIKLKSRNQLAGEYLLADSNEKFNGRKSEVMERVCIPKEANEDPIPFYFERMFQAKEGGLFCIVETKNERVFELFELLGKTGIGSDKNLGYGLFDVEKGEITIDASKEGKSTMLLSLYIPTREEMETIDWEASNYELLKRGGFIAGSSHEELQHLRKRSVYALGAGSVLKTTSKLIGKVVDLRPDWNAELHPVYRSGKAIAITL